MNKMCRTCLAETTLIPVFGTKFKSGRIHHSIQLALGLTVMENDGLPQVICKSCLDTVNKIIEFRAKCYLSEKKLLALKNNQHEAPLEQPKILFSPETDNNLCEFSNISTEETTGYEMKIQHNLESFGTKPEEFKQKLLVTTKSKNNKTFMIKLKKCNEYSEEPIKSDGPVRCKICKRQSKNISSLYSHLRIHTGFNYICEFCGKKFYASTTLKRHCMSFHGLEKELVCSHCDYKTVSITRLKEHGRIHSGIRPFECDVCGTKFHTRSSIIQHLRLHVNQKTIQCDKCPSMFKSRRALSTHTSQTHVRDHVYLCYLCDKRYAKNTTVRHHLARRHGVPRERQGAVPRFSLRRGVVVNMT